jgi:DNA-binding beta-propeller fold protein YncE
MAQTFDCPTCGAPLDVNNNISNPVIRCPYCNASVVVPEELRGHASQIPTTEAMFGGDMGSILNKASQYKEIVELARSGNKIEAIKKYRELTNVGLKEAKDIIDAMAGGQPVAFSSTTYQPGQPQIDIQAIEKMAKTGVKTGAGVGCFVAGLITFIVLVTVIPIIIAMTSRGGPLFNSWSKVNPNAFAKMEMNFGGEGVGPGLFTDARHIAIDPTNGNILVGEFEGGRIQVFDSTGKFLTQWQVGDKKTVINKMAIDRKGIAYLIFGGDLHRYTASDGKEINMIANAGGDNDFFEDVALAADGGFFVTMGNDTIVRFNADDNMAMTIPQAINSISDDHEMETRLAIDGQGNIYALGTFNESIFKFSSNGKYITRFGGDGDEKGQFSAPYVIAVDNQGRVYVSDSKGIQVFDADGRYLDVIDVNASVYGITITDDNTLYTINSDKMVYKYSIKK